MWSDCLGVQPSLNICPPGSIIKGSLAVDKYASKLTSLQEKLEVVLQSVLTFSQKYLMRTLCLYSSRTLVHCSTQVLHSAQNTLGRPFLGWARYILVKLPITVGPQVFETIFSVEITSRTSTNACMKVMEMIKKNVSMEFEALKKHARMNHWQMDEVGLICNK